MPEAAMVAKGLKAYRLSNSKTQFEMGSEMGLSTEEISLIERAQAKDMKSSTLKKLRHMPCRSPWDSGRSCKRSGTADE